MSERPPVLIQMNLVRQAAIDWLWQPYLARGKLAILDGDPGAGKSFFAADLAARLSRGGAWPDGAAAARPANTLFLNAEDGLEDTLLPRLDAAGADLGRVASLGGLSAAEPAGAVIQFPYDLDRLRRAVVECRAELVVIDPMMAFFPPEVSTNNDQSIRMALTPLAGLAAETGTALLLVRHLNKGGGGKALYRGSGSIGIIGAIRTALFLAHDPNDPERRLFAMSKSNIGPLAATLAYRLAPDDVGRLRVEWLGACDATADDLCGGEGRRAGFAGRRLVAVGPGVGAAQGGGAGRRGGGGRLPVADAGAGQEAAGRRLGAGASRRPERMVLGRPVGDPAEDAGRDGGRSAGRGRDRTRRAAGRGETAAQDAAADVRGALRAYGRTETASVPAVELPG